MSYYASSRNCVTNFVRTFEETGCVLVSLSVFDVQRAEEAVGRSAASSVSPFSQHHVTTSNIYVAARGLAFAI
jgi:hypothetical protein